MLYFCGMGKYRFIVSKVESVLTYSGAVYRINKYEEFNRFIEKYSYTAFAIHYSLFKNQCGVYRFNLNNQPLYIGYSENLFNRVRISFFNHCFTRDNITFQYILCENKEHAMDLEAYYIKELKPKSNLMNKKFTSRNINNIEVLEFCSPMTIFFNDYWRGKQPANAAAF